VNNGLSFRFREPRLEDVRVRQAIIAGIDRQKIVDTLFTKNYPLATGALAKTALGYVDTSSYTYDAKKAASLLDEAGWKLGSDGIREKDGEKLTLTFNEALPQPRSKEVVTLIQEQLGKLGIRSTSSRATWPRRPRHPPTRARSRCTTRWSAARTSMC
jgi:peptide/nickel transport system substrate-binding protein